MEDPERLPEDEEAERRRRAEEAMEQMLRLQEEDENADGDADADGDAIPNDDFQDEPMDEGEDQQQQPPPPLLLVEEPRRKPSLSYIQTSFLVAAALIYYALRTRQQWYLALVYLSSSKWAYIILGNALVAVLMGAFQCFTKVFLNGLRIQEAEGLGDFFRWNITETCLALTMFRSELSVQTGILFLLLVLTKCLHWVADLREGHLRMTQEAVVVHPVTQWPALQWPHFKLLLCLMVLQLFDILAVLQCGHDIVKNGPSVMILFAFEGAILLVSVISNILLWHLHAADGIFHYWHETTDASSKRHHWIHAWKDHKATLVFAVEVQAQAAKFFFYVTFFAIVMTYYGMPINLFREVYMSFQQLKQRLTAFSKYRQLMASMNRFASPTAEELLDEEPTCIICRDEMLVETTKRLPGCGHLFHKSCLREWLVQQQSCPTCRGDIAAGEARQRLQDLVNANAQQREMQEQEQQAMEDNNNNTTEEDGTSPENTSEEATSEPSSQQSEAQQPPLPQQAPRPIIKGAGATRSMSSSSEDAKPPATTRPIREKRVRIVPPPQDDSSQTRTGEEDEAAAFPAFYRVVQDTGASVYNNGESVSFVIRVIPFGIILLGLELEWRDCEGDNQLMVRMPDGWVCDDGVERIVAIPFLERTAN
jgi:E3 ubiquitin-protein ligase synoviolin